MIKRKITKKAELYENKEENVFIEKECIMFNKKATEEINNKMRKLKTRKNRRKKKEKKMK